jgi:Tfp pilus assembly protein PilF
LSLATGGMTAPSDFMEMAQLALQADLPSEGKQVIDKGIASGALSTGAQADRAKRLKVLVDKKLAEQAASRADDEKEALAAKSGDALLSLGMNLVYSGQAAKGVQLIQQGIAKGSLKRPDDARLHLGIAQVAAGDKAKAQTTFKTVQGSDGTADLARLWSLYARRNG